MINKLKSLSVNNEIYKYLDDMSLYGFCVAGFLNNNVTRELSRVEIEINSVVGKIYIHMFNQKEIMSPQLLFIPFCKKTEGSHLKSEEV